MPASDRHPALADAPRRKIWLIALLVCGVLAAVLLLIYAKSSHPVQGSMARADGLDWRSCHDAQFADWFEYEIPTALECTTFTVPMYHSAVKLRYLDGHEPTVDERLATQTVTLAITRHLAANPKDSLLLVSGGPGQHSLNAIAESIMIDTKAGHELVANFDIYGFAPRGIAPSNPQIICTTAEETTGESFVQACIDNTGLDFLRVISTESVVHDIEALRQTLKLDKVAMLGWSYGTKVVARYAELFGDRLSAAVLDGVVDSTEDMFSMIAGQERGYDRIIRAYFDDCAYRFGCPFDGATNGDYESKKQQLHQLLTVIDGYQMKDRTGRAISAEAVMSLFYEQLMWQDYWSFADKLLVELSNQQAYLYNELSYDYGDRLGMAEDMYAINCSDATIQLPKRDYIERMRAIDALSDFDNYTAQDDEFYLDACYYWPQIALGTDSLHIPKPKVGTPKLLFVGQTGDPATPYQNAVNMARHFDGWLLTKQGEGHVITFTGESRCIDRRTLAYLYDPSSDPVSDIDGICQ